MVKIATIAKRENDTNAERQIDMRVLVFIFTLLNFLSLGQINYKKQIDSLKLVKDMPYICTSGFGPGCGDKIFWNIVKSKDSVIVLLINNLDNSKMTKAIVPLFGANYTVADIAYVALKEIIQSLPTYDFIDGQTESDCGNCVYWNYVRKDINNRKKFKKAVRQWYDQNKDKLVWIKNDYQFRCGEMGFPHPNGGHYELKN